MRHRFKHLCLAVLLLLGHLSFSQSVTFKPNAALGMDAMVNRNDICTNWQTTNWGNTPELDAYAWTWYSNNCGPGAGRSLIRFDGLNTLPAGTVITYAELRLFGLATSGNSQGNSHYPGSPYPNDNTVLVSRVVSPWTEGTVTWATQPGITTAGQVAIPASTTRWNYNVALNVTAQVAAMMAPGANNGFSLMLQNEAFYRSMLFASSDHPDSTRWPELYVKYSLPCDADFTFCTSTKTPGLYNFKVDNPQPGFSYKWDFGDGGSAAGTAVAHTYTTGSYKVCLYAYSRQQGVECSKCTEVCVKNDPADTCAVKFKFETPNGYLYYFYGKPYGPYPVASAEWDFGDGTTSNDWTDTKHEYEKSGTYEVCLTVKYENGCVARYCYKIEVKVPCAVSFDYTTENGYYFKFHGIPAGSSPVAAAEWDFGDGTAAGGWADVDHQYREPGTYIVCVTVKYENGCTARFCKEVIVGCSVKFKTETPNGYLYYFYGVPFGPYPVVYAEWDFGDGTTSTDWPNTKHEYTQSGVYEVCVKVKYENGCVAKYCYKIEVKVPCDVKFTSETPGGYLYYFHGIPSSSSPVTYAQWDFGDGTTSNDWTDTKHQYRRPGIYKVCLTVKYENGCTARYCSEIEVKDLPCGIRFEYYNRGNVFYFKGSAFSSGGAAIAGVQWDFGDGGSSNDWPETKHEYGEPGRYEVCVKIKFEDGCDAVYCTVIIVSDDIFNRTGNGQNKAADSEKIKVTPNPANTATINVALDVTSAGTYRYTIYDARGKATLTGNKVLRNGAQTVEVNINGIAPGKYWIAFTNNKKQLKTGFVRL